MDYLLIAVMFVMAAITAAHACHLESRKRGELITNYMLSLMSIIFALGFSLSLSVILTGEAKNLHLLTLLSVIPPFIGIVFTDKIRALDGFLVKAKGSRSQERSEC